jgi:hypothetical protein
MHEKAPATGAVTDAGAEYQRKLNLLVNNPFRGGHA